jgi:hypothetical protein
MDKIAHYMDILDLQGQTIDEFHSCHEMQVCIGRPY